MKYPIYTISARWIQNGDQTKYKDFPRWIEGLPEGRVYNSTGFSKMFKEDQSQEQLDAFAKDWWINYCDRNKEENIELVELEAKYKEHEEWVLGWFNHETFDVGQSDAEVLQSFEEFVRRYEYQQDEELFTPRLKNYHCLMGAEDRWRWYGTRDADGNNTPAPCRCIHCKDQGVIRIAH